MKKIKKATATLLVMLICASFMLIAPVPADAYENVHPLPALTGNQQNDIVEIALSQVGYTEVNNDTYFGKWYGLPNQPWCAMFVSWCATQAGVPQSVIKHEAAVRFMQSFFASVGRYHEAGTYTPQRGDLVFYDSAESTSSRFNHIGFVLSYDAATGTLYTVEGNTTNPNNPSQEGVFKKTRDVNQSGFKVAGYANPDYAGTQPVYTPDFSVTTLSKGNNEISGDSVEIAGTVKNGGDGGKVSLYFSSELVAEQTPGEDGKFSFTIDTTQYKDGTYSVGVQFTNTAGFDFTDFFTVTIKNTVDTDSSADTDSDKNSDEDSENYTVIEKMLKTRIEYANEVLEKYSDSSDIDEYKDLNDAVDEAEKMLNADADDDAILEAYDKINECLRAFMPLATANLGDVNADGKVNLEDVTAIQKIIAEIESWSDYSAGAEKNADVDYDNKVSMTDVICIQRYIAELITSF